MSKGVKRRETLDANNLSAVACKLRYNVAHIFLGTLKQNGAITLFGGLTL